MSVYFILLRQSEPLHPILQTIIFLVVVGSFLMTLKVIFEVLAYILNRNIQLPFKGSFRLKSKKLSSSNKAVLLTHFPFYQKLPKISKSIFEHRVANFISLKDFQGRDQLSITEEMKVLIAASAVQLTFGLRDFRFLHFPTIIVYPEKFFSTSGKAHHLGETNPKGSITFSWYDYLKGIAIEDDNLNLGIHEFSHALFINYLSGRKQDQHFEKHYELWKSEGSSQFFNLRNMNQNYIRDYAQVNLMEFFAVCVECFFETPHELLDKHPEIYLSIKKLLKQNPVLLK